jgi:hypothetical protein
MMAIVEGICGVERWWGVCISGDLVMIDALQR